MDSEITLYDIFEDGMPGCCVDYSIFDQWLMKMERSNKISILIFLITFTSCGSGLNLPKPVNLELDIVDGEVTVVWDRPVDAPPNVQYNVQMERYGRLSWTNVTSCMGSEVPRCDLTHLIQDYRVPYKVRVQLMMWDIKVDSVSVSNWTVIKKFLPNDRNGKLRPPSFTLVATSTTLTVKVHAKPIFQKLFLLGVTYTIYLQERGHKNKTTPVYLRSRFINEETKMFDSLKWGTEYCVSIMVMETAGSAISHVSPQECLLLPEQEWYIIAVSSLSIMGVMIFLVIVLVIICCFLRYPEKTPVALKSPKIGWAPLIATEALVETVTDKGWFLTTSRGEVKNCVAEQLITPQATINKGDENGQSWTSMDSGVSMQSNSTENREVSQADSGCGSMGGSESSASYRSGTGELEDRMNANSTRKREDSGVGLRCPMDCSESLDVRDADLLSENVQDDVNTYRTQSPSAMQIHACDGEESLKQICIDTTDIALADVVSSYRAGTQSCVCSRTGQCVWCQTTGYYRTKEETQYRNPHAGDGFVSGCQHIVDTSERDVSFPSYHPKTHVETESIVSMGGPETSPSLLDVEAFPFLTTLSTLPPLVDGAISCSINTVPLSLCDVELTD